MTDYHGNTTAYTYTNRNELSTLTAPGSKTWTFHYNDLGQPTYYDIPNGMTTNYGYDSRNRLTAIEHKDGTTVLDGFTYALDAVGNISKTTNEDGSFWDYLYDGRYRLTSAVRKNANETIAATYAYTYDAGDNMLTKVEPFEDDFNDGNYTGWSVWSGTWSAANNYLRMTPGAAGTIAQNSNTDNDLELRFAYTCNDTSNSGYGLVVSPRYASSGDRIYVNIYPGSISLAQRVSGVWSSLDSASVSSAQGVEYTIRVECDGQNVDVYRSAAGQLETKILETTACTVASTNYISFSPTASADYSIDDIRILADGLSNTTTFAVNNANELASMTDRNGTTSFGFDDWGRMTSKSRASYAAAYAYRYGQMLRSVTSNFPGEGDVTLALRADGKAFEKVSGGVTTRYRWSNHFSQISEENVSGTLTRTLVGRTLAAVSGSNPSAGTYRYYYRDILKTPRTIRDQNKSLSAASEFQAFGVAFGGQGEQESRSFTGQESDQAVHLYIAAFRMYDPDLGRWLTRDPLASWASPNLYNYVQNNPLRWTDLLGLEPLTPEEGKKVVEKCEESLGAPYKPGGNDPRPEDQGGTGIDCSHLANQAYCKADFPYTYCRAKDIPLSPDFDEVEVPQAGDIIWWPGHVGIYNPAKIPKCMINAPSPGKPVQYQDPKYFFPDKDPPKYFRYDKPEEKSPPLPEANQEQCETGGTKD